MYSIMMLKIAQSPKVASLRECSHRILVKVVLAVQNQLCLSVIFILADLLCKTENKPMFFLPLFYGIFIERHVFGPIGGNTWRECVPRRRGHLF